MASKIKVDTIEQQGSSGIVLSHDVKLASGTAIKNAAGTALLGEDGALGSSVAFPAGHILQSAVDTDTGTHRSFTSSSYVDIAGLSLSLTSKRANSKFFLHFFSGHANSPNVLFNFDIKRVVTGGATTDEIHGNASGGITRGNIGDHWTDRTVAYMDSPSLAAGVTVTYTLRAKTVSGTSYWVHETAVACGQIFEIGV